MRCSEQASPKVFISYSWTSDEFADWVMNLAERLRGEVMSALFRSRARLDLLGTRRAYAVA